MRRSIDEDRGDQPDEEQAAVTWAVAVSDDYEDGEPRLIVTLEEEGAKGAGLSAHITAGSARRLRVALANGLRELGAPTD
ncbi:MAG TPA: hypothetical protein VFA94_12710 [Acidimicrobiales bacterium]|nr:hypothetical protein [Acidimicrobiales bacterium]